MPIVNGIEREYRAQLNVVYVSMDEQEGVDVARDLGIMGTPTILLLDEKGEQINVIRGVPAETQVIQLIEALIDR
jgi:thioredoxin-like negative regulator of GroEL